MLSGLGLNEIKILTAERRIKFMDSICARIGETSDSRSSQFKTFEACDNLNQIDFQRLRDNACFDRLKILDELMVSYIKYQIAHDDIKIVLSYLSSVRDGDPILKQIIASQNMFDDVKFLRNLNIEVRQAKQRSVDSSIEVKKTLDREWNKTFDLQDLESATKIIKILKTNIKKFENLKETLSMEVKS